MELYLLEYQKATSDSILVTVNDRTYYTGDVRLWFTSKDELNRFLEGSVIKSYKVYKVEGEQMANFDGVPGVQ
jgi:hypothetical protein